MRNKTKKHKKQPMTSVKGCALFYFISLVIYLAIIIPLRLCVFDFSWHWFVFGLAALIIFYSFIFVNLIMQEKAKLTDIQKKNAAVSTVKYILYFWLIDCFYMVRFNDWLLWTYIIGIVVLIKVYYSLTIAFLRKTNKDAVLDIGLIVDFLIGIALTIYLIYLIPNEFENLQTIVTAIIAAVYGGLITLVGVAWTIKHSDIQKHNDELIKAKPLFTFNVITEVNPLANNRKICLVGVEEHIECNGTESYVELENSNNSSFVIKRLYFDGSWHDTAANSLVLPNAKMLIQLMRKDLIEHPLMEIEDIYSRKFYYEMIFVPYFQAQENSVVKTTLSELKEITELELIERTK